MEAIKRSTEGKSNLRIGRLARISETIGDVSEGTSMTDPSTLAISLVIDSAPYLGVGKSIYTSSQNTGLERR